MKKTSIRGSMEMGMPLIIVAILGAVALHSLWDKLPAWVRIAGIAVIVVLAVCGIYMQGQPTGLATMAMHRELAEAARRKREEKKKE